MMLLVTGKATTTKHVTEWSPEPPAVLLGIDVVQVELAAGGPAGGGSALARGAIALALLLGRRVLARLRRRRLRQRSAPRWRAHGADCSAAPGGSARSVRGCVPAPPRVGEGDRRDEVERNRLNLGRVVSP